MKTTHKERQLLLYCLSYFLFSFSFQRSALMRTKKYVSHESGEKGEGGLSVCVVNFIENGV